MLDSFVSQSAVIAQAADAAGLGFLGLCCMISILVIVVPIVIAQWRIFDKAGEPGWAAFIPVYNGFVLCRIVGKPEIWGLYLWIPIVGIVIGIIVTIELAKSFGKDIGFAIGMMLLPYIFFLILGLGSAEYIGPGGQRRRRRRLDIDDDYDRPAPRPRRRDADDRVRGSGDDIEEDPPRRRRPRDDDED